MIYTFLLLYLAFQSFATVSPAPPEKPDDLSLRLNKRVTNYNLGVFNLPGALVRVSNDFQIPMGIVWLNSPAERAELPFAWKDASVKGIIESIANTQPGYRVHVSGGVVHVQPSIPDTENFLETNIGDFKVHDIDVEVAYFKLHSVAGPRRYGNQQISIGATGDSKVSIDLKNSTVRGALDALTLASNRKIWIVTFLDDTHLTRRGLRRSMSLWSDKPGPDEGQPAWDTLRWGDPMPPLASTPN